MSLGKVVSMAALHSREVWGHAPPGNFDDFRCSEAHSGAYKEAHRVSDFL